MEAPPVAGALLDLCRGRCCVGKSEIVFGVSNWSGPKGFPAKMVEERIAFAAGAWRIRTALVVRASGRFDRFAGCVVERSSVTSRRMEMESVDVKSPSCGGGQFAGEALTFGRERKGARLERKSGVARDAKGCVSGGSGPSREVACAQTRRVKRNGERESIPRALKPGPQEILMSVGRNVKTTNN